MIIHMANRDAVARLVGEPYPPEFLEAYSHCIGAYHAAGNSGPLSTEAIVMLAYSTGTLRAFQNTVKEVVPDLRMAPRGTPALLQQSDGSEVPCIFNGPGSMGTLEVTLEDGRVVEAKAFHVRARPSDWSQHEPVDWDSYEDGTPVKAMLNGDLREGEFYRTRRDGMIEVRIINDEEDKSYRVFSPEDVQLISGLVEV